MFIQTEPLDDPDRMRFLPGCTVLESDASENISFADSVEAGVVDEGEDGS